MCFLFQATKEQYINLHRIAIDYDIFHCLSPEFGPFVIMETFYSDSTQKVTDSFYTVGSHKTKKEKGA